MRKNYTLLFFLLFLCNVLFGQNAGDFMSVAPGGDWASASSWKVYNVNTWENATQYPGQTPGSYTVTIAAGSVITVPTTNTVLSVTTGDIFVKGALVLKDDLTLLRAALAPVPSIFVQNGVINFHGGKVALRLPEGSNLFLDISSSVTQGVQPLDQSSPCNNNVAIFIGSLKYSSCKGGGNTSEGIFELLNQKATTVRANASSTPSPAIICTQESFKITGSMQTDGTITTGTYSLELATKPKNSDFVFSTRTGSLTETANTLNFDVGPINSPGEYIFRFKLSVRLTANTILTTYKDVLVSVEMPTVWNGLTWSAEAPSSTNRRMAVIDATYTTAVNGNITACGCTVNAGTQLTVSPNGFLEVENNLINNGSLNVESDGNLIQKKATGNFTGIKAVVKRNANLKRLDYNYWASPVSGQNVKAFSPETWNTRFYTYNEWDDMFTQVPNPAGTEFEANGKGYAIRAPDTYSGNTQIFAGTFTGKPNNGTLSIKIERGNTPTGVTYTGDGYNLVGNPYPSNIDFYKLFDLNKDLINKVAYFWTYVNEKGLMQGSEYRKDGLINNYAVLNGTGGTPATLGYDAYIGTPDPDAAKSATPNEFIKVGQGFIVQAIAAGMLKYENSIRTTNNTGSFFN